MSIKRMLLLWRHGKSAWDNPGLPDMARPLAPRGRRAVPLMAEWLAEHYPPDRVCCSPARRTLETWSVLAETLAGEIPVIYDSRIYEADWPDLLTVVQETPRETGTLLLIGHNPGFEDLTAALAEQLPRKFSTAACAVLRFKGDWAALASGNASLAAFQWPKALR
ncbi:MAG TPA: histidine phosphatase family protein [Alphaproteobacteria bacterium]|nr:histidine phosphatase family protein [Alphaproteobacteria bacterium]